MQIIAWKQQLIVILLNIINSSSKNQQFARIRINALTLFFRWFLTISIQSKMWRSQLCLVLWDLNHSLEISDNLCTFLDRMIFYLRFCGIMSSVKTITPRHNSPYLIGILDSLPKNWSDLKFQTKDSPAELSQISSRHFVSLSLAR